MTGGQPDRVPCTPDMSNMVPCRLTGKPFWDIYLHQDPPLWQAYLDAVDYFGIDAWFFEGRLDFQYNGDVRFQKEIVSRTAERIVERTRIVTPRGDLFSETTYPIADSPTSTKKPIADLGEQLHLMRYLLREPIGYTTETAHRQKAAIGDRHAFGTHVCYPGFQLWMIFLENGLDQLAYAMHDGPELLDELHGLHERVVLREVEMIIDSGQFDFLLLGGSGSVTMASPLLFDRYAFPTIQKICRICKEAGLPTMLHSCGRETHIVKRCAEESDLDCINPLEVQPMGDCTLSELKQTYGKKIALMGNLHTTDVMLRGTAEQVGDAARQCKPRPQSAADEELDCKWDLPRRLCRLGAERPTAARRRSTAAA